MLISQFIPYYSDTILNEVYALARHKGMWGSCEYRSASLGINAIDGYAEDCIL